LPKPILKVVSGVCAIKNDLLQIIITFPEQQLNKKIIFDIMSKEFDEIKIKKDFYLGFTILTSVCYVLSFFILPETETGKNIVSIVHNSLYLFLTIFATFWIRRQIMIIALFLDLLFFNLKLLINPILIRVDYFYTHTFYLLQTALIIIASLILFIGLWKNVPVKFARKEFNLKEYVILILIILFTLFIQIIARLI